MKLNHELRETYKKPGYRFIGLRGKLLLATLTLFILPLAGLSYLKELELFLKHNHSESVLVIAKTISSVFRDNASLITQNHLTQSSQAPIYCHSLSHKKYIDGYSDDWFSLQNRQKYFYPDINHSNPLNKNMSLLCANDEQYYYFLVTVKKVKPNENESFGQIDFIKNKRNHSISFQYLDYAHQIQNYNFKLTSPGWVTGQLSSPFLKGSKKRIQAQWQENKQGFILEFKIPVGRINHYMAFKLQQVDDITENETDKMDTIITTATLNELLSPAEQLNPILMTDPLSIIKLDQLVPTNTRLWLLNKEQYISAKSNKSFHSSKTKTNDFSLLALYRRFYLLITDYPEQQSFYGSNQAQINSQAIQQTLKGQSTTDWLDSPHNDKMVLSVATPIFDNDNSIIGTLVLEQANETLLALQDKTFERILFLTLVLFFSIVLILLFLSSRLLKRIIKLRDDTNLALSNDGIISNQLYRNDNDEIGDLARSFSTLLSRVDHNQQYLRSLSGKLSHELRTPLTIIKSSLENMETSCFSDDNKKYAQRANDGCIRLSNLLNRMSEASRLEQSINSIEKEDIEIVGFMQNYIETLRVANNNTEIIFQTSLTQLHSKVSPELIAQLLDKLFSNAFSFHKDLTPIRLSLTIENKEILIEINNFGDLIESDKLNSIFSSLTSYRTKKGQDVHLGLGLYICNLICQFHNGQIKAINHKNNHSVSFIVNIPIK
ncbi:MAG: ATP-binding protein [Gammaproteobacteria bacterium]|nr:ATP-binding protein [Gammaproteobacteria bacterium]